LVLYWQCSSWFIADALSLDKLPECLLCCGDSCYCTLVEAINLQYRLTLWFSCPPTVWCPLALLLESDHSYSRHGAKPNELWHGLQPAKSKLGYDKVYLTAWQSQFSHCLACESMSSTTWVTNVTLYMLCFSCKITPVCLYCCFW